ncbi:Ulp1 protease family, catalytic domain-containing protein [Cladophialophora immunda]|nr:Ulp1 protease family, catalytic domain-containing protein [Cladophialophora immunda]
MADTSSFMDWHPQTPPPAHNPYQGRYIPGGWPVDPPTPAPPTAGVFMPPRRPSPIEHIIPVAKRICAGLGGLAGLGFHAATQLGRCTVDATTTVVIVPTVFIVRRFQQRRRDQRPRQQRPQATQRSLPPPLSQSPWNRAVANERFTARQTASTVPQTPTVPSKPQPTPISPEKEQYQPTEDVLYEVPEFRPQYVLNPRSKNATPRIHYRRARVDRVFPDMPRFTPPREPKPVHLPTPEEKSERSPLECAKLESPYPQLRPIPASPPSPAETITSVETLTPSAQLQQALHTVTESDTESNGVISSIQRSRKRRIHTQGSRATEDGEPAASSKRVQTTGPSVGSPQTPTPAIVVQDAPPSGNPKAPSPTDSTLLSPPRLKLRRFNTPRSVRPKQTLPKTPKTPLSDISSMCDCSPGNYHIDAPRSPVKSEISSFFDGTPPPNLELDAHVFRMIMAGGGSPIPASETFAESESFGVTAPNAAAAPEQTPSEMSNSNEPVASENRSETNNDLVSTTGGVTTEMTENVPGLANHELLSEFNSVTNRVEQDVAMQETEISKKESPKTPKRVNPQKPKVASPIDLTDDKETSESSSSATSSLHTPEKQLAELTLDDVYTPEQPTPKATPHSSEKIQRVTRAESKRLAILEEKTHYEIVPLTEDWEKKIQTALRHGHGAFKARDFTRVVPLNAHSNRGTDQWLNDEVINGYLNLVVAHGKQNDRPTQVPTHHAFVSFFFNNLESRGYDSVKRWASRAKIGGKNLLETEAVFIPVNSGSHWTLCVVSGKNRTIAHYNSLRGNGKRYINIVKSWVSAELGSAYKESEWTFIEAGESPQQTNMDDCGVFTITSARQIMLGLTPMSYNPDMIPLQRKRIVAELVNGALLKSSS